MEDIGDGVFEGIEGVLFVLSQGGSRVMDGSFVGISGQIGVECLGGLFQGFIYFVN